MTPYLIGIDGGGTNARLVAVDIAGSVLGNCRGKSTNIESNPPEVVRENLRALFTEFFVGSGCAPKLCKGVCLGTAGVDTQDTKETVEGLLTSLNLPFPSLVVNDAEIALAGQTEGKPGIILISGTGSIGLGVNAQGEVHRVGGYGYLVSDEGSSYWVAKEAIAASLRSFDRIGPDTRLLAMLENALKLPAFDKIIDFVYTTNKSDIARLAPLVPDAAAEGDEIAADIMKRASIHLCNMAAALAERLNMCGQPYPLVYSGGFLTNTPSLVEALRRDVAAKCPNLSLTPLAVEAEWGAVYLIAKKVNVKLKKSKHALMDGVVVGMLQDTGATA
ncbi:MAG: hypothetical protein LBD16_05250 [Oscillospiraceae bacterium]|nr:hypothetical protein [Oscillospiraceae bacterium]